jgi:4-amino-4-deoxy-L-arabinose transferase-like glycosyltransferase
MQPSAPAATSASVPADGPAHAVAWIIAAGTLLRLALIGLVPLGNDEAYYVDWARNLQPGYLDHPPAVAWLIALPLRALGASPFAVRLPALALQTLTLVLAVSLLRARAGARGAVAGAVGLQAVPLFFAGGAVITPDAPLALAWVGTFWALQRALDRDARWAVVAGALLGLGALSKLTAGMLGIALLAALLAHRDGRRLLATPWPWAGAGLALAVAWPMLRWNAAHGWPSFAFQAAHGLSGPGFSALRLLRSIGGQLGYVSPVLLGVAAVAAGRALLRRRDALETALAFSALPVIGLFTAAAAITRSALPHWPGPGWLSAVLLVCLSPMIEGRAWRLGLRVGFAEIGVGLAALAAVLTIPVPASLRLMGRTIAVNVGPGDDLLGWREGAAAARAVAGAERLAAAHWVVLGQLGWYDGRSPAYVGQRITGPSFYDPDPRAAGKPLLVVTVDRLGPSRADVETRMGPLDPAGSFEAREGERVVRVYRFWWWRPPPPSP